jgi:hypothetical protein
MPLFAEPPREDPLRAEIAALDVDAMSPLEAMTALYELRERARSAAGSEPEATKSVRREGGKDGSDD